MAVLFDPLTLLLAVLALLIVGISKGGLGGGLGVLGVPLMSLAMPPAQAAAILLPILCVMDLMAMKAFWKGWSLDHLQRLIPAAIIGIVVGALTFRYFRASDVRLLVGLIAVGFALNYWFKPFQFLAGRKPGVKSGMFWGSIAGFTSFIAHAGGPPVNIYLLPQQLDKTVYQATTVIFFTIVNYVKLIPYTALGQFNPANLSASIVLLPLAALGIWLGYKLHHRMPEKRFFQIAYVLLFITGCKLIYDGVSGLLA
ncbi:sulfite exporter TauE/SafE family protein [Candidatus Thiothrix sp. Deng01]|uniref:Probable membrane transporter protein n=1 Tax=Candidatus Thiothrix phosphatis TaxID=3112415 RepID=A0ABU6CWD4_9GAMM|nr:sulfite exporter TauE/SafE family protein [Candidatus Thiothrix sp. Deng01]MEB4590852.1 sulfite exporter TauE/SafE family protein [Candidatus Thiothrix sp. Deng01]